MKQKKTSPTLETGEVFLIRFDTTARSNHCTQMQ
jgi:hypothetical protein